MWEPNIVDDYEEIMPFKVQYIWTHSSYESMHKTWQTLNQTNSDMKRVGYAEPPTVKYL